MAFEKAYIQLNDGRRFGPGDLERMSSWAAQGRVTADMLLVDAESGESRAVGKFETITARMPSPPLAAGTSVWALISFYSGLATMAAVGNDLLSGVFIAPLALVTGIVALARIRNKKLQGKSYAMAGLLIGCLITLPILWLIFYMMFLMGPIVQ